MYKFLLVVALVGLTACGSSAKTEEAPAVGGAPVADSVTVDSSVVPAPTTGENEK